MSEESNFPDRTAATSKLRQPVSVRAHAPGYSAAILLFSFFSLLFLYFGYAILGITFTLIGILAVPILALTDRIIFDGRRLTRTGALPALWHYLHGLRMRLKIRNIEQVETFSVRTFRRAGNVYSSYRTTVFGNGIAFSFSGGGRRYRRMVTSLFRRLPNHVLDNTSLELSEYFVERREAILSANKMTIPSADVLEGSLRKRRRSSNEVLSVAPDSEERAAGLRRLANELRFAGSPIRAIEAFRRALLLKPTDGWLLFEFACCLHSFAHSERDRKIGRKAVAVLRLAEKRAEHDSELLARIGETYFQMGYSKRAASVFQKALDRIGDCFRAVRGLADIALSEGKLAHVVHNFSAANRMTDNAALRRWAKAEAEYFTRLNDDDEYMELEVSRLDLLEKLDRWRAMAFRTALYSLPLIAVGSIFDEVLVTNTGWLVSAVAFLLWAAMSIALRMLSPRIPFELLEND